MMMHFKHQQTHMNRTSTYQEETDNRGRRVCTNLPVHVPACWMVQITVPASRAQALYKTTECHVSQPAK